MRNILLAITLLFVLSTTLLAYVSVDYACRSDCLAKGYGYQYCTQLCSYDNGFGKTEPIKPIIEDDMDDFLCRLKCRDNGNSHEYCKMLCSY